MEALNGEMSEVKNDLDKLNEEHDETQRQVGSNMRLHFVYRLRCHDIYVFDHLAGLLFLYGSRLCIFVISKILNFADFF